MLLRVFGGSLGVVFGALGTLLADILVLLLGLGGIFDSPKLFILASEEPSTAANSSPGALMARQMAQ